MTNSSPDRISPLPDCLLELILVLLPLHEAVRTSVLSKRWISLWKQIPKLVFNRSFFQSIRDKSEIITIIHDILNHNHGPLSDFTFSLSGVSSVDIGLPVYYWTPHAGYFNLDHELYQLLSLDKFGSLKRLCLEACVCTTPYTGCSVFNMLMDLSLYGVDIYGGDLSDLVSNCRLLDTLTLISLPLCPFLFLHAPNLRVFCCNTFLLELYFDFTPRLEKMIVSLDDTRSNGPEDIVMPFESVPSIKYIELNGCFLKYMNRSKEVISRRQDALNHLVHIKLTNVSFEEIEVGENVLSLIRHSPNLETIMVSASSWLPHFEPAIGVWPTGGLFDVSLNGLRHVYLANITGKQPEVEFIGLLLSKFRGIEVMDISLHCELTDEEALRIEEEIGRFEYASSELSLKFNKATPEN